jgi:hypothetical protein
MEAYDGTASTWRRLAYEAPAPVVSDYTLSANGPVAGGTYNNVTINAGVTGDVRGLVYIRAYGTVTINGSLIGDGNGYPGSAIGFGSNVGAATSVTGSGLGFGSFSTTGSSAYSWRNQYASTGGLGTTLIQNNTSFGNSIGGNAGATLIIVSDGPIIVGASAVISANGGNGSVNGSGTIEVGGAGGGSAGLILLQSQTSLSLTAGSALNAIGGNGANGLSAGGGGGGGGGYIVLNSPATTDSSTKTLTGGLAGSTSGLQAGGGGASFGGNGGVGGQSGNPPGAGSTGVIVLNDYL